MRLTPEKIAEWKSLVPKLNDDSDDHMDVAHSADMAPQHTVNFRHAKNAHEAAWAINSLIADLEEAQELIEPYRKDAERFQELLSRVGDDWGLTIVKIECWSDEYPGYAWFADLSQEQVIAELDAAIAAKGESE